MKGKPDLTDILLHQGEDDFAFGAVAPPLFETSIFHFKTFRDFQSALSDEYSHYLYTLGNNPTVNLCEEKLAALEHADRAKLVSSGNAAAVCAIMSQVKGGDHAVIVTDCYNWVSWFFREYLSKYGVEATFVEGTDVAQFEKAMRPNTRIFYLESPTTFTFKLQDLQAVASLAKKHGIKTIIDNSWATPIFQNPIDLGIDMVVCSCSKYLGGNSDLVAGAVFGNAEDMKNVFNNEFLPLGCAPDPFQAWLILRNIRTLHLRMPVHFHNALAIAKMLSKHPKVESVLYPFLPEYPQYELAKRQMKGGSGLFSFRLKTRDVKKVELFTDSLKYFKKAVSWGGYESLVFPQAVHYAPGEPIADDKVSLVRVHIGIEDEKMLEDDLLQALDKI